jgi:RNA polymerase sigma factor (sigma-70 family)
MANAQLSHALRHLRRLVDPAGSDTAPDGQLLQRFTAHGDEAAFTQLVRRHGGMVLGVCRSVLGHAQDAEDTFQATFLLLAVKAGSIRRQESVASWLHGAAYRLAQKLKTRTACRRLHEQRSRDRKEADAMDDMTWREFQQVLHAELGRLPEKYRAPLVLCCMEGKTRDEAAQQLGWSPGTLKGNLERGRQLLRRRLTRRGLAPGAALLAALLSQHRAAALPSALVQATAFAARAGQAGRLAGVSTPVRELVREGMKTMLLNKLKLATALVLAAGLLLLGIGVGAHRALGDRTGSAALEPPAGNKAPPRGPADAKPKAAPQAAAAQMTVTGRVVDAAGKAAANAQVAVIGLPKSAQRVHPLDSPPQILAQGRADAQGRFRLTAPRTSKETYWGVYLLAAAAGHGLTRAELDADAWQPVVKVTLAREHILRGRLVGLQGAPAPKVRVRVFSVQGRNSVERIPYIEFRQVPRKSAVWPGPVSTDEKGRFEVRGLPADRTITLQVEDERFARQLLVVRPDAKDANFSLAPGFVIEGTVTCADTGKPAPHARLRVMPGSESSYMFFWREQMEAQADAQGKFRFSAPTGTYFWMAAYAAAGSPYGVRTTEFARPKGKVSRKVNLTLPRGVLVRGKVVEQASGKPVAGANVTFVPFQDNNPYFREDVEPLWSYWKIQRVTGPKGEFEIPVLPGPGHLLVTGPTADFVRTEITEKKLNTKRRITDHRNYPDGLAALNLKPQPGPHEVTIKLRRGVTLKGQVLGPSGKPVARAVLASRAYLPYRLTVQGATLKTLKDGRFELHGCDPEKSVPVYVLDPRTKHGAAVDLSANQAGKVVPVKLRPCGQAKLRLVDKAGKPIANMRVHVQLVLTPGGSGVEPIYKPGPTADLCYMANLDNESHSHDKLRSDAQGRLTLPALIPGATFKLIGSRPNEGIFNLNKEFTARAGKTLDLGDVVVKPPE